MKCPVSIIELPATTAPRFMRGFFISSRNEKRETRNEKRETGIFWEQIITSVNYKQKKAANNLLQNIKKYKYT
ncbi:hypothetical protein A9237_00930 [Vibrio owensii]|nr:hypothetical protein A9237_00930 [Vibrio owensii]